MANHKSNDDNKALRQKLAALNSKLEKNIASLKEAQALTHLGSWEWDVKTDVISWSDELYRIYGLKPQSRKIDFDSFMQLIHPDDREIVGSAIDKAYKTAEPFEFVHRTILPNKKVRYLHGKGKVDKDKSGNIIRMMGTSQDVTEREKADKALHLSDQRFKAVTAATNDVVYDVDMEKQTLWANDALTTNYGFPKSEVSNAHHWWLEHIHPEDRARIKESADQLLENSDTNWFGEYRFKKHNGTYIEVRDRAFVLRDENGRPVRKIGSVLDITRQKELERAKDKFISLVSHQLRTPLTSMRLLSEMLSEGYKGDLTPSQQDYVDKIKFSTLRMIQLVGDILNVSQIERGRLKVMPVPTDIPALIKWHIDEVIPLVDKKKITIQYDPPVTMRPVPVDPILFSQIIHNLLTNAIRYTVKDDTVIQVDFKETADGYLLSVSDQGIGIPKAVQPRIFTSFYRADNAVKAHSDGSGLGLYLIKLILQAAGGNVWFESQEGKGTTFFVSLPKGGMEIKDGDKTLMKVAAA